MIAEDKKKYEDVRGFLREVENEDDLIEILQIGRASCRERV